jgi:hypothetical protein
MIIDIPHIQITEPNVLAENRVASEKTEPFDIPKKEEENSSKFTEASISSEGKEISERQESYLDSHAFPNIFSQSYISHNTSLVARKIVSELKKWEENSTPDSLAYIAEIKDIVENYQSYLYLKNEDRILISLLKSLLESNNWESITQSSIKYLRIEISRFIDGDVNWKNLETFSKQLYRNNFSVIGNLDDR